MKINWQVRLRNPLFWLTIIPATATFVYAVLGAFGVVPFLSEDTAINAGTAIVTALSALGVLVDPTTAGIGDSHMAMTYEAPKHDAVEEENE